MKIYHYPGIFDATDMERAKAVILTTEGPEADTATRWALETPYVLELMQNAYPLRSDAIYLDYGCGIGRISKAMIDASGCFVIGVDPSEQMCRLARDYVASDRFIALSPAQLDILVGAGLRVDAALAVWVLQHCLEPQDDIARIRRALKLNGPVFVLNMPKRAVPVAMGEDDQNLAFTWLPDDVDVAALLRSSFGVVAEGQPDSQRIPNMADAGAFWMALYSMAD